MKSYSTGIVSAPAMCSAATMPWASATCASIILAVQSPMAYTPGTLVWQ